MKTARKRKKIRKIVIKKKISKLFNFWKDKGNRVAFGCFLGFLATSTLAYFLYFDVSFGGVRPILTSSQKTIFPRVETRARAVAVYDTTTQKFIYEKNGNAQLPLASITKVMTSVSAMRIAEKTKEIKPVKFSGNWWNVFDLMRYALVSSSNSGVTSIAEAMSVVDKDNGATEKIDFIGEMNAISRELGLKTTYFVNETGLDINETLAGAYGSAKDTAKMFAYAIEKYPHIFGATKYPEIKIVSKEGADRVSKNTNIDVSKMTTLIASKTGTTDLAGGNLVIAFDAGISHPIVVVLLGSTPEDRFKDAEAITLAAVEYLASK